MNAKEQPKLFQLLFMTENAQARRFDDVFDTLGETAKLSIEFVMNDYGLTTDEARFLFQYVWTFTYGVSAMSATGMCAADVFVITPHCFDADSLHDLIHAFENGEYRA